MIRIERRPKRLTYLHGAKSAGAAERAHNASPTTLNPRYKVYSEFEVKDALAKAFGRKCAYCESILAGSQPGDVEHFRPKAMVIVEPTGNQTIKLKKPGYPWLASVWSNLLICCADCNRPRTQLLEDNAARVTGKANYFPLADETKRATKHRDLKGESPLLLDPCRDDPEQHLVFTDEGRIEPAIIGVKPSSKGEATIRYCGLARVELLQMRSRHRRTVMAAIRHTISALERNEDPGTDLDDLLLLLDPKEAYVAYTRHLVRRHMQKYIEALLTGLI